MTTTNKFLKSVKIHRESKGVEKFQGVLAAVSYTHLRAHET